MTDSSNRPDIVGAAPALLTLGGIGAAFGLAACCAIPMALASFGVGTAWLAGVALFAASHRPVFLGMAAVGLIGGGGLLGKYRLRVPVALRWLTAAGLLVGVVLLYYGFTYA